MDQEILVQYARDGVSGVMQGTLVRYDQDLDTYVLLINRNMKPNPATGEMFVLPKTETEFFAEDVFYIQRQLESEDDARRAIEIAGAVASGMVGGPGGLQ
jgi:hypothetical protein